MIDFLKFTAYSVILVFLGAFLQYRYDFLGLGVHIQYGQYNIVPGVPAVPQHRKDFGIVEQNKFFGKADFKDQEIINIKGVPHKCVSWYNSTVMLCTPLEKSA